MKKTTLSLAICVGLATLAGCSQQINTNAQKTESAAAVASNVQSGIETQNFDPSVRAQDDFFRHVNGKWLNDTQIPNDKSAWGSFYKLADDSDKAVNALIQDAKEGVAEPGSSAQKIGDFYASFMAEQQLNELGFEPIQPLLKKIASVQNYQQLSALMGDLSRYNVTVPVGLAVIPDGKDATKNALYMWQSGIGMPDRDYYLKDDKKSVELRAAYLAMVTEKLQLIGEPQAQKKAKAILELETKIAKIMWDRTKTREVSLIYNPQSTAQWDKNLGQLDWQKFAQTLELPHMDKVIVSQPSFFEGLGELFAQVSVADWKDYLTYQTVNEFSNLLSEPFAKSHFEFYSKTLRGVTEQQARWQRGVRLTSGTLGEEVGKLYVQKHFSPEAKARMEELVKNLIAAYRISIDGLDWMSDETKQAAQEKLSKFRYKIGYPNKWREYNFEIKADDLVGNVMRAAEFESKRQISMIGKPVDKEQWEMTPQTVNAYYHPLKNEIVFPAAILQPPFFNMQADDAVNYGGIGAVIGHELGHGFDDQGAQFDGDGNLRNWWHEEDLAKFKTRGDALVEQFDSYQPFDDANVNGRLTLGENIGDLGGLTVAYKAYQLSLQDKPRQVLDGYTPEQRFFIGYAQVWRAKIREEALRERLVTDNHSPAEYRANGSLTNFTPFYEAFALKEGDKLYKPANERVKIW
ncbi:M13 family metallopeptidase [Pseudoalteromonas sp. JBTF-M23]|uniref:M13 family metallopeptidase n=1 Tax=Pseudoalteromonas caenipelagi TaxID=2726988 RepID=A0A849VDN2_9GAMM|nr:M13 family metallopeptidase [Pseudoalteromonas caenipelagi]NOU50044.1 M13 family metallopeptidase [Pseudoalteromonas caenipelagi]